MIVDYLDAEGNVTRRVTGSAFVPEEGYAPGEVDYVLNPETQFVQKPPRIPVPVPARPLTMEQEYTRALDHFINAEAKSHGYDSRITCAMRAGYPGPYQAECIAFGSWMDECYSIGIDIVNRVKAGETALPTKEEMLALMPDMEWPV